MSPETQDVGENAVSGSSTKKSFSEIFGSLESSEKDAESNSKDDVESEFYCVEIKMHIASLESHNI